MSIRSIVQYPDSALKTPCLPVERFDESLSQLTEDLLDTMRAAPGVGITAAHIGQLQRVTVIELERGDVRIYINPEILTVSDDMADNTEGSVSMPGVTDTVRRPAAITFRYQDLSGEIHEESAEGFLATCVQHEIDQLDGIFWLQRLSRLKRDRLIKKWEKMRS